MIIREKDLKQIEINEDSFFDLQYLLTPNHILALKDFPLPKIISPEQFTEFEKLLEVKEKIKTLELVPVKDDKMHEFYNSINKDLLAEGISKLFEFSKIFMLENQYPYWLSKDTKQYIIWVQDGVEQKDILAFISKCSTFLNVDFKDLILFERPLRTKSKLVRGTLPHFRHIHFWIKNNTNEY